MTTQFTLRVQNVHHRPKRTLVFSDIFPKQLSKFYTPINRSYSTLEHKSLFNYLQLVYILYAYYTLDYKFLIIYLQL